MLEPPRVLFVDDDVSELLVFRRLLRDTRYVVDTVRSASQAIDRLAARDYAAVVVDDDHLTDLSGPDLLAEAARLRPHSLRILLGGTDRAIAPGIKEGGYQLIVRPFIAKPLLATLVAHQATLKTDETRSLDTEPSLLRPVEPSDASGGEGRARERRLLLTLAELAEAKAGYSSGHGARVSALAGELARQSGIQGAALAAIEDAALIHDVGELAVAPEILRLARRLDPAEEGAVRVHVESSHQIARRAGLHADVLLAVRHHHERVDGSGHPGGLVGEAIPIGARVIAIADTWDALATDRPYRRRVALDDCAAKLQSFAGEQLDQALVTLFLDRRIHDLIDWTEPPSPGLKLV